ncbi:anti-repressor SinI [Melghiribacillus thermohalophilus]|uniref:Anti-repressor SinI n=1 Tax=Melghiribacillus thermohalophilus TaxID=1324956 RepID=A0A4R3NH51_9BACI|nr:anti-repressor SinI family protein [Melghiribacillus thermohalophilus]TCT26497.1 anti-repressor SinI [Melghiribacillus thermohalophilus]
MEGKMKLQLESFKTEEDKEWLKLMKEAKQAGISKEEVKTFIQKYKIKNA